MSSWRTKAPRSNKHHKNGRFSSPISSTASIVADLDDVLIQILSYLPIKTLMRSKRVSKRWLSLITNPDFTRRIVKSKKKHSLPISGFILPSPPPQRAIQYSFVSLLDDEEAIKKRVSLSLPLRFTDHPSDMIIMQSVNGLLLCRCTCDTNLFDTSYYVYNPTTKQNTLLPKINDHDYLLSFALAFDPCKSPNYKVFCLTRTIKNSSFSGSDYHLYHIEVYSSNDGFWRRVFSPPSDSLNSRDFDDAVFCNGTVHWFGTHSKDCLSFDIDQEHIKILPLPILVDDEELLPPEYRTLRFLEESRGNLYYFEVNDQSSSTFLVYEMEKNSLTWYVKYNVNLETLAAAFPEMIQTDGSTNRRLYTFSVIGIVKEETDAESYILLHIPNKAVKYNFTDKTFKKLCSFEPLVYDVYKYQYCGFQRSFPFIDSLANV
ncbi:unnamed protein product [Cochlearia groenlandica]